MIQAKKSLGQHWLKDQPTLEAICEAANLQKKDTVLEIGPGLGDLTRRLIIKAGKVIAVELDESLADNLSNTLTAPNLEVIRADILKFDLSGLPVVAAKLFEPPPKVDSRVIILKRRPKPPFKGLDTRLYFQLVKAGFAGRRKKLRGSLAAGLSITKPQADELLRTAGISGDLRAQNLSLQDWHRLYLAHQKLSV
jgi:16S rRNA A1518/A1519 N6-dimethyltransferase RsmA/KsgA/DIM1 with predicted DNA glycosylase/AP lyase activity